MAAQRYTRNLTLPRTATYKTFFIIMCCITSGFYISAMVTERWLRLIDRLPSDVRRREQVYDWLAIFFACVGSAGLILLSIVSCSMRRS